MTLAIASLRGVMQGAQLPALSRDRYARVRSWTSDPHVREIARRSGRCVRLGVYYVDLRPLPALLSRSRRIAELLRWGCACDLPQGIFVMAISSARCLRRDVARKGEGESSRHGRTECARLFVRDPVGIARSRSVDDRHPAIRACHRSRVSTRRARTGVARRRDLPVDATRPVVTPSCDRETPRRSRRALDSSLACLR